MKVTFYWNLMDSHEGDLWWEWTRDMRRAVHCNGLAFYWNRLSWKWPFKWDFILFLVSVISTSVEVLTEVKQLVAGARTCLNVHGFSICCSSVRHFPERSWTVEAFPCFTVVKSVTSWYALLVLFFLRFSSISLHCSPIQFSTFSCTSWCCCSLPCISQILQARIFSFSVLSFGRTD